MESKSCEDRDLGLNPDLSSANHMTLSKYLISPSLIFFIKVLINISTRIGFCKDYLSDYSLYIWRIIGTQ